MITRIELLNAGLCQLLDEEVDYNDNSPTGYFIQGDALRFTRQTTLIKARRGVAFGIEYRLIGQAEHQTEDFETRLHCPLLINPDTGEGSTQVHQLKSAQAGQTNFDSYKLEYDWEVQPGQWIFEVWQAGRLLLRQAFTLQL